MKHPYYSCFRKGCERYRKSIKREKIEADFEALLSDLTPTRKLVQIVAMMFKDAWSQRAAQAKAIGESYARELKRVDEQISVLLDRIVDASTTSIVTAYEKRITTLEKDKLVIAEKRDGGGHRTGTFEELFELALLFLANPSNSGV